ncbi:MAG: hypothetical protein SH857_16700 [Chitinophagales bacterium]|nr:hypothetical protein [Chitinophagales bacterium]
MKRLQFDTVAFQDYHHRFLQVSLFLIFHLPKDTRELLTRIATIAIR